jgi:hypothetical protein
MSGRNNQGNMAQNRSNCCNMNRMYPEKRCAGCDRGTEHVDHMMPGMTFVPWQKWEDIYPVEEGLENGTIFKQLNKPFIGRK